MLLSSLNSLFVYSINMSKSPSKFRNVDFLGNLIKCIQQLINRFNMSSVLMKMQSRFSGLSG